MGTVTDKQKEFRFDYARLYTKINHEKGLNHPYPIIEYFCLSILKTYAISISKLKLNNAKVTHLHVKVSIVSLMIAEEFVKSYNSLPKRHQRVGDEKAYFFPISSLFASKHKAF